MESVPAGVDARIDADAVEVTLRASVPAHLGCLKLAGPFVVGGALAMVLTGMGAPTLGAMAGLGGWVAMIGMMFVGTQQRATVTLTPARLCYASTWDVSFDVPVGEIQACRVDTLAREGAHGQVHREHTLVVETAREHVEIGPFPDREHAALVWLVDRIHTRIDPQRLGSPQDIPAALEAARRVPTVNRR